jgi:uncharacterized protein
VAESLLARARRALFDALSAIDAEAEQERAASPGFDRGPALGFIFGALCLVFMEYSMGARVLAQVVRMLSGVFAFVPDYPTLRASRWFGLTDLSFWVLTRAIGFLLLPSLAVRLLLGKPELGLRLPARLADLKLYGLLFLLVLPLLFFAGSQRDFVSYYPFYRHAADSWLDLLVWELLYAFQFFCVEFFFRGFLLGVCRKSLGSHAVLAAMVPYCMVHFSKPLLEVLGAIPAGLLLGTLAMRTHSIWGGVLLHVAVAWTMDILAIAQTTGFPRTLLP